MNTKHNRQGSVLLMAVGLLTILAILSSTFLIVSNLDSEETEALAVRAGADPLVEGVLAKAVARITADRYPNLTTGPYGAMPTGPEHFVYFMDCPHEYSDKENADSWLATEYAPSTGIVGPGYLTNLDGEGGNEKYELPEGTKFGETVDPTVTYPGGVSDDKEYVDTDCDGIPDAYLWATGMMSPIEDANETEYYAAVRVVDLGSRICVNTAGGWTTGELVNDRPISGPAMVNLRNFLDNRSGASLSTNQYTMYNLIHTGDRTGTGVRGRIGSAAPDSGGTASKPVPASTRGFANYCGSYVLGPARPTTGSGGYQPFGIGDEAFFLNACKYVGNASQFAGRINQLITPLVSGTNTPLPDTIRRQLTTLNSVSGTVRRSGIGITEPLAIDTIANTADCDRVYHRMKIMLQEMGLGKNDPARSQMAAHFAANLWAYCANGSVGEPWAYTCPDIANLTVYGARKDMVITQVFARHISNWKYDANDPAKDNSACGYAVELANPTYDDNYMFQNYELGLKPDGGVEKYVPLTGGPGIPALLKTFPNQTVARKRVIYGFHEGADNDLTEAQFFGASGSWHKNDDIDFRVSAESLTITLYRKCGTTKVPIDQVTIGKGDDYDLDYDTNIGKEDIKGPAADKSWKQPHGNTCAYIRRDDRLKTSRTGGIQLAKFNMALYKIDKKFTGDNSATGASVDAINGTYLGLPNAVTAFDRCVHGTGETAAEYNPGIYRPRHLPVSINPSTRESLPTTDYAYYLPSLADMVNIYFTGPARQGNNPKPFTIGILEDNESDVFSDRPDRGRIPTMSTDEIDQMAASPLGQGEYPPIPAGYLFHEFFSRAKAHQARNTEKQRVYGLVNINTVAIPNTASNVCAAWHLPWPTQLPTGSIASNTGNRLSLGAAGMSYSLGGPDSALGYIRKYRNGDRSDVSITNLRNTNETQMEGFLTPGEVGIPLAAYVDNLLKSTTDYEKDADHIRARNCLFSYISDCITTRSDIFACYVTVQVGQEAAEGRRWRYVAVIDRSNVVRPTDKAAVIMLTQLR